MFKSLALSRCLINTLLLPPLLLGAASAQAAPTSSERDGLPQNARPLWIGDQRYYLARDTWFLASGSDTRYTPVPAPREIQMVGANIATAGPRSMSSLGH